MSKKITYRLQAIIEETGFSRQEIYTLVEREMIRPVQSDEDLEFDEEDRCRIRFIGELKQEFGVNDSGVEIILHLLDQIHGMRKELSDLFSIHQKDSNQKDSNEEN